MRPKKVVLCAGADEQRMSERVFLLETRGYRVIAASTAEEALSILGRQVVDGVDLLIVDLPLPDLEGDTFAHSSRATMLAYDNHHRADFFLPWGYSVAMLLERMHILVARKCGPKPLRGVLDASRENE